MIAKIKMLHLKKDGYKWHKYGQKKLTDRNCVRSYYRCSNKFTKCMAKKFIDIELDDPNKYTVACFQEHNHPLHPLKKHKTVFYNQDSTFKSNFETQCEKNVSLKEIQVPIVKYRTDSNLASSSQSSTSSGSMSPTTSSGLIYSFSNESLRCKSFGIENFDHFCEEKEAQLEDVSKNGGILKNHDFFIKDKNLFTHKSTFGPIVSKERGSNSANLNESITQLNDRNLQPLKNNGVFDPMLFLGGKNSLTVFDFISMDENLNYN